jgi:hypothetical protein
MKTPIIIFLKALVVYALITFPALLIPVIYFMSLYFVIIYGWFAGAVFTLCYLLIDKLKISYDFKTALFFVLVPVAVLLSFQLLEEFDAYNDIWQSGIFLLFPLAATVSGWISLFVARKRIREAELKILQNISGGNDIF